MCVCVCVRYVNARGNRLPIDSSLKEAFSRGSTVYPDARIDISQTRVMPLDDRGGLHARAHVLEIAIFSGAGENENGKPLKVSLMKPVRFDCSLFRSLFAVFPLWHAVCLSHLFLFVSRFLPFFVFLLIFFFLLFFYRFSRNLSSHTDAQTHTYTRTRARDARPPRAPVLSPFLSPPPSFFLSHAMRLKNCP